MIRAMAQAKHYNAAQLSENPTLPKAIGFDAVARAKNTLQQTSDCALEEAGVPVSVAA